MDYIQISGNKEAVSNHLSSLSQLPESKITRMMTKANISEMVGTDDENSRVESKDHP
jgi:hypothetical protein